MAVRAFGILRVDMRSESGTGWSSGGCRGGDGQRVRGGVVKDDLIGALENWMPVINNMNRYRHQR